MQIFDIPSQAVLPSILDILKRDGIPDKSEAAQRVRPLVTSCLDLVIELGYAKGIFCTLEKADFQKIFSPHCDPENPLDGIYTQAERLALFAVTMGEALSTRIKAFFSSDDYALAYILDICASLATDLAADYLETCCQKKWKLPPGKNTILRYSPGYCGWNITGQKPIFQYLKPEQIGITLSDHCLMQPLKSISGIIVAGTSEIHYFNNDYLFCRSCQEKTCRKRIQQLRRKK